MLGPQPTGIFPEVRDDHPPREVRQTQLAKGTRVARKVRERLLQRVDLTGHDRGEDGQRVHLTFGVAGQRHV